MKNLLLLITLFLNCSIFGQTSTQLCNNMRTFDFSLHDYQLRGDHQIATKQKRYLAFRASQEPEIINGLPVIAIDHIEKIRVKTWFNESIPTNTLNGSGANILPWQFNPINWVNGITGKYYEVGPYDVSMNTHTFQQITYFYDDLDFPEDNTFANLRTSVYFYVKPEFANLYPGGSSNRIYLDNGDFTTHTTNSFGNVYITDGKSLLRDTNGFLSIESTQYRILADLDSDGILNENDNCPNTPNTNQLDSDADLVGNLCDNCIDVANTSQEDMDNDGIGDLCDNDNDNDGVLDTLDNCPTVPNSSQIDLDSDGIGDNCDNCPSIPNPNQNDSDFNGVGDVCESPEPDISISENDVFITSDCNDCPSTLSDLGSNKHIIQPNTFINIQAFIKNNSPISSGSSKVKYYLFDETSPNGSAEYELPYITNVSSIPSGNEFFFTKVINGSDLPPVEFGDYKVILKIDADNDIDEADEDNNKIDIPTKFQCNSCRTANLDLGNNWIMAFDLPNLESMPRNIQRIKPINQIISYNLNNPFNGPLINMPIIENQTIDVSHLSRGQYVIHVNDSYVKKFFVIRNIGFE